MKWLELSDNQQQFQTKLDLQRMRVRTMHVDSAIAEHSAKLACRVTGCYKRRSLKAVRKPVMFACSLSIGIVRSQAVQSMKRLSQTWNTSCTYVHLTMRGDLKFPV